MRAVLFLFIITLTACQNSEKVPDRILEPQKMIDILVDIHLLESKIQTLNISVDSSEEVFVHFEPQIFLLHNVDSAIYRESLEYYLDHPDIYESIYSAIVDSLLLRDKEHRIN